MSASLLSFLSIVLAFVGGLALGWFGRKLSGAEFSQSDIDDAYVRASRSVTVDVEGCRAAAFREASQEAEAVGKALAPSSIVWKAIVRRLSEFAHPMLVTPPVTANAPEGTLDPDIRAYLLVARAAPLTDGAEGAE